MNKYSKLEKQLDIVFDNYDLIDRAFVHKSYVNENKEESHHNERLEFLGDAVLELSATRHLFDNFKDYNEGEMTSLRSALVKGKTLAEVSKELGLGEYLYLSHGEEKNGGREKNYILANLMEALIGAIYLDKGFDVAHQFISKYILVRLEDIIKSGSHIDSKSKFQEKSQELLGVTPYYTVLEESGPDHLKNFTMGAYIDSELIATGTATSKQRAEQAAARQALINKGWQ